MPKMLKGESYYKEKEKRYRLKAGIERLISDLKYDHRMKRNYLSCTASGIFNTLMASSAYNMRKWMRQKRQEILNFIFC